MADPKLVKALADLLRTAGDEPLWWPDDVARRFVTRHRLVQLPEQPDGWTDGHSASVRLRLRPLPDGTHPVYIIPGDPKEVDDDS